MTGVRSVTLVGAALIFAATMTPQASHAQTDEEKEVGAIKAEMDLLTKQHEAQESAFSAEFKALNARFEALESKVNGGRVAAAAPLVAPPVAPIAASPIAQAQNAGGASGERVASLGLAPSPAGRALSANGPSFSLSASSSGGQATVTLGRTVTDVYGAGDAHWLSNIGWEVDLSAPLDNSGSATTITTLDSLASGEELKFKLTYFGRGFSDVDITSGENEAIVDAAIAACNSDKDHVKLGFKDCRAHDETQHIVEHYDPAGARRLNAQVVKGDWGVAAGLSGGIGYKSFSFEDLTTAKAKSTNRAPLEGGAFFSLLPPDLPSSITLGFTYQYDFKAAKSGVLCPALMGSGSFQCLSGPLGKPLKNDSYLTSLDFRAQFQPALLANFPLFKSFAISPQLTYDANNRIGAVDFPIYLVADSKGNLIGGLRFGYSTDKHDFVTGVFVDSPFSVFH